jgi:hypothetical protein
MRDRESFIGEYRRLIPGAKAINRLQDVALVDLCLHFLTRHGMTDTTSVEALPHLLNGYPSVFGRRAPQRQLVVLRQLCGSYAFHMAWAGARQRHINSDVQTAYSLRTGAIEPGAVAQPSVAEMLDTFLAEAPPHRTEKPQFAEPGPARVSVQKGGFLEFAVPTVPAVDRDPLQLPMRAVNPPVAFTWEDLRATAQAVDKREAAEDWPAWLPALHLIKRLERVEVDALNGLFYADGRFFLRGAQHIVGMLSSGKSTFLNSVLFTICGADFAKRALVLTADTASAADLVTRLNLHGVPAALISAHSQRDRHLAAIHWINASSDQSAALDATAEQTRALGVACPLEGLQPLEPDDFRTTNMAPTKALPMNQRPCNRLQQLPKRRCKEAAEPAGGTATRRREDDTEHWIDRTCPLIHTCPTHAQQQALGEARVYVMTAGAYLGMTPAQHLVQRQMAFPEIFQYLVDVVLIDEVDAIQSRFDEHFCLQEVLMSGNEAPYALNTARGVMDALQRRGGAQYSVSLNAEWHARLNQLQSIIALIYHLLLTERDQVGVLTKNQSFTASSLLSDLWRWVQRDQTPAQHEASVRYTIEHLNRMSDRMLGNGEDPVDLAITAGASPTLLALLEQLQPALQRMLLEGRIDIDAVVQQLKDADLGTLRAFDGAKARTRGTRFIATVLSLAALTQACLSIFSWLIRNQAAVEEDFGLNGVELLRRMRRMKTHYGDLIPLNPASAAFGLMFEGGSNEPGGTGLETGATLKLVHHMGVGRYLLTHMDRLARELGHAGPHVVMLSGTSWAGGAVTTGGQRPTGRDSTASPKYDVQVPVAAILRQPQSEMDAIARSVFEMRHVTERPLAVSGQPIAERHSNLKQIAQALCAQRADLSALEVQWGRASELWPESDRQDRRRALIVCNNYTDARIFAEAAAEAGAGRHRVYLLVQDASARKEPAPVSALARAKQPIELPRSRVAQFGFSPEKSILVAPLGPISRGHNILNQFGKAAISSIYFVHRPHPRPDELDAVVAELNRFAIDLIDGVAEIPGELTSTHDRGLWVRRQSRQLLDESLAARVAYSRMTESAQTRFAWDLITMLWQTIGRGIRSGVPVYVCFVDARFAPGAFNGQKDGPSSSCLRRAAATLRAAVEHDDTGRLASALYLPFLGALERMFDAIDSATLPEMEHSDA